jgi:hypothetical protein
MKSLRVTENGSSSYWPFQMVLRQMEGFVIGIFNFLSFQRFFLPLIPSGTPRAGRLDPRRPHRPPRCDRRTNEPDIHFKLMCRTFLTNYLILLAVYSDCFKF